MTDAEGAHAPAVESMPAAGEAPEMAPAADDPALVALRSDRYLTRDQIRMLDDQLTMGDSWRSMQEAPDDKRLQGMLAFYYVAKRIGVVPDDSSLEDFLIRVRQDDWLAVLRPENADTKSNSSAA